MNIHKLSVKSLLIGLSAVALLSVLIVTMLSWSLITSVSQSQTKLKRTSSLIQAESSLSKLVNEVLGSALSSSSSQNLKMFANSEEVTDASNRFDVIFNVLSKEFDGANEQLVKLNNAFKQLLLAESKVRNATLSILKNNNQLLVLSENIDQHANDIQSLSESLLGKIRLNGRRIKRKIKKRLNNEKLFNDKTLSRQLLIDTELLINGDHDKLLSSVNKLNISLAKLSIIKQKLMTSSVVSSIVDLKQNQGNQLIRTIAEYIHSIEKNAGDQENLTSLVQQLNIQHTEQLSLLFGQENSADQLKIYDLETKILRDVALKGMLNDVNKLSKILRQIGLDAKHTQEKVVAETDSSINAVITYLIIVVILVLFVLVSVALLVTRLVTKPMNDVIKAFADIASGEGDLTKRVDVAGVNEVVVLSGYFNDFVSKLETSTTKLESEKRKLIEEDWIKSNFSLITEKLQGHSKVNEFSTALLNNLIPLINGQIGAFYIKETLKKAHTDELDTVMTFMSAYAYSNNELYSKQFKLGDGIIGQCALEKKTILLKQIPENYIKINSGLGKEKPKNIIISPILFEDEIVGVIEVGSIHEFSQSEYALFQRVTTSVGIIMNSILANLHTQALLKESQNKTDELEALQEELKAQQEELKAQQSAIKNKPEEF